MIRNGELTSESIVQAYIDRCKEVNPILNAIVDERFDEALKEARIIDRDIINGIRTKEQMKEQTPLLGVPVTVKENKCVGLTDYIRCLTDYIPCLTDYIPATNTPTAMQ